MTRPDAFVIALDESSGPVSPRYQYALRVRITAEGGRVTVAWNDGKTDRARDLPADAADALWSALGDYEALGGDAAAEKRDRVGVSFNALEVTALGRTVRFDYLLTQLKDPAFAAQKAAISAIKAALGDRST